MFGDATMAAIFSERASIEAWLQVERALAGAQGRIGVIPTSAATAIESAARVDRINIVALRRAARNVGYPILPLLDQIAKGAPEDVAGFLHWGATTQDIMDTGLALQMTRGINRCGALLIALGDDLAAVLAAHESTLVAARTHGQHAVPTTFGAKVAVWLSELGRHVRRIRVAREQAAVVQLFGAGGTSAATGEAGRDVRHEVARVLGLAARDVPWHTARDGLAEVGFVLAAIAATCGKIAREVIELSRTEIGEVSESKGHFRGASSTMPQKANPILSEAVVGMCALAQQHVPALLRAMEAGHERAAGEWQIEWDAVPMLFALGAGCLVTTDEIIQGLHVYPARMLANLRADGGALMAEAAMMRLAPALGRRAAHSVVYRTCVVARDQGVTLEEALRTTLTASQLRLLEPLEQLLDPATYLGEALSIARAATSEWASAKRQI
jgi:3-carboxy-cis,cis-muconate cycloisomerase